MFIHRIIFLIFVLATILVSTWALGNDGRRNLKSAFSTLHEVQVDDNPHLAVNVLHNRIDNENDPEQPLHIPVPHHALIREQNPKNEFREDARGQSYLAKDENRQDSQLLNIAPEEPKEQTQNTQQVKEQQQNIALQENTEEEIQIPKQIAKDETIFHLQEKQPQIALEQEINGQQVGVNTEVKIGQNPEQAIPLQVEVQQKQEHLEAQDFNMLFQQQNQGQNKQDFNFKQQTHQYEIAIPQQRDVDVTKQKQNVDIPQQQQNVHVLQQQQNLNIPHLHQNVNIPQQQHNVNIPQQQANVNIPQQQHNVDIPQQQQNVDIPQQQHNVDIPQHQQNVDIPQHQQNVDIPQQLHKKEIPQQQHNVDVPQQQLNVDVPQQQLNVDVPQQPHNVDFPQQQQNVDIPQQPQNVDIPQQPHNIDVPQHQQNVEIPQQQQNVDIPQHQQNVDIPQQQLKVDIPQQQHNVVIPQHQQNVDIPQHQQKDDIPQKQRNVDIPQQQHNVDIPQQPHNVDIPQQQHNVDIPQQQQNADIPQHQQNVDIPQQQQNVDIPQQQHNVDIPQQQQNVDIPQQRQNVDIYNNVQLMEKEGPKLQPNVTEKQEKVLTNFKPHPMKELLPVVINWSIIGVRREFNITCSNNRRCLLTPNRDERFNHHVVGIFFYGTEFAADGLPLPRKRGHIWSVLHEESPKNNDWLFNIKGAVELFNLTATFKRESHYPFPTMWLKGENELMSTEYAVPLEKKNALRREGLAPVVFVHSDCNTPSDRSHYMKLLQKHLHIDSYGKCEHNKDFPQENLTFESGMGPMTSPDFYKLVAKYKFAFAFENAVCDDYVTEKFWRPLILGVVPIAFGSPRIKDMAPNNHSIIDIRDFRSVKEVADFIKYLDEHDEEYRKYVVFKQTGITNPVLKGFLEKRDWGPGKEYGSQFTGFQCFVCEKVHELQEQMAAGLPTTRYQGTHNQYGCPLPNLFNEEGQYVVDDNFWWNPYSYGYYYLKSLQHHIDNNIDADIKDIHKMASQFLKNDRKKNIKPEV